MERLIPRRLPEWVFPLTVTFLALALGVAIGMDLNVCEVTQ